MGQTISYILFTVSLFFQLTVFSQSGTVTSGGDQANATGSINYSVGQIDYVNAGSVNGSVNQGLQQPYEFFQLSGIDNQVIQLELNLYPNPTTDMVQLVMDDVSHPIRYLLYDMNGKILDQQYVNQSPQIIPMQHLASGTYLLEIYLNNTTLKTYKIIKK